MQHTKEELQAIFNNLDDNEQFGVSFGLFPIRLEVYKLDNHECASLVEISQKKTGVVF